MDNKEMVLLRELQKENVWWQTGEVPKNLVKDFKRSDYYEYKKFFDNDKVNVIIGPRRVGKSTVLYQLVSYLMRDKNVNKKNIIFLSLDRAF
ncbi:MAG: AAA family ATPase, partial [Candidatus Diapherotrites archaeon]|nr:AAA family ATPase [Candidatus Diapherotrites archaeon]